MTKQGWERHEQDVAKMFGLEQTLTSGNKFFDPGDAVHRGRGLPFPVIADAKYTEHSSISIRLLTLRQWSEKAASLGKRFIMPIRFHIKAENSDDDWVLMSAHDLAELLELVNKQA
jgi:hypothetical protein